MTPRAPDLLGLVWTAAFGISAGVVLEGASLVAPLGLFVGTGLTLLRRRGAAAYVGMVALAFFAGHVVSEADQGRRDVIASLAHDVPRCSMDAVVSEHAGGLGTLLRVDRLACGQTLIEQAGTVIVDEIESPAGTEVAAEGWILPFTSDDFDRARERTGAGAAFHPIEWEVVRGPRGLLRLADTFRRSLARSSDGLEERRAGLLRGLTIGDTSGIDETTEWQFRRTGLAHLVAVSGSNVAIVLACAGMFVARARPAFRVAGCAAVLGFYVLVVGPEPSVLRAAAMGGVALGGILWGRRAEPLQALGLAIVVLVALRPTLVTSVGLHLSAAATLGIVLWARSLADRMSVMVPIPIAYALAATLSAQIAVAPILIVVFGEVSVVAPLANLLAAAAVPPATLLGLSGAGLGLLSPALGTWAGTAAGPFAGWIVTVAEWLSRPSWAAVECPSWIGWALALPVCLAAARSIVQASGPPAVTGLD